MKEEYKFDSYYEAVDKLVELEEKDKQRDKYIIEESYVYGAPSYEVKEW